MPRIRIAACLTLVLALIASFAMPAQARRGRSGKSLKLSVRRPKGKARSGESVAVRVKIRNRTDEERTARLVLTFEGAGEPAHDEILTLAPRERRRTEVSVRLPAEYEGRKLRISASLDEEEDQTQVKVRPPEDGSSTPDEWESGRLLFAANCAACHDVDDRDLRKEDLDDWLEAVREGEDDMPAFPGLSAGDVRAMRDYVLAPDRGSEPGNSEDDAEWIRGRELYATNCAACHGAEGGKIAHEDFGDWKEAIYEGEDDMPTFPSLSLDDVRAMRKFVLDPDRDVTPSEPPPPPPPPPPGAKVTYEGSVKAILSRSCVACHRAGSALGSVQLDTYATAFENRTALVDSVVKGRMPPGSALATGDTATLENWLGDGAPEK